MQMLKGLFQLHTNLLITFPLQSTVLLLTGTTFRGANFISYWIFNTANEEADDIKEHIAQM